MTNHKKTEMINRFREQFAQKMHELGFEYNNIELYQQAFLILALLMILIWIALDHNERLEFLGDAVLELTVSRYLFDKHPDLPEGN